MEIALIYARAANGVIGANGSMPWHLPEDLAHFKQLTLDCPVIMGRKTWDSLPPRFRPLPQRVNIVITRQMQWRGQGETLNNSSSQAKFADWDGLQGAKRSNSGAIASICNAADRPSPQIFAARGIDQRFPKVQRAGSLAQALELARQTGTKTAWIIGGAQIYAQALPLAARVEVTEIARDYAGDTYAPVLDQRCPKWQEAARSEHVAACGLRYAFVTYRPYI